MGCPERLHHVRRYFVKNALYSEADLSVVQAAGFVATMTDKLMPGLQLCPAAAVIVTLFGIARSCWGR